MFALLGQDVEPFIEEQKTRLALDSYKGLAQNLVKTLKLQKRNLKR